MEKIIQKQTLTYDVLEGYINGLKERYPSLQVTTCGKSHLSKKIYSLVLGEGERNVVYIGGTHGSEWITSLLLLRFCEELLSKSYNGTISGYSVSGILKNVRLIIIPELNPDGIEIALRGASACGRFKKENFEVCKGDFTRWNANARGVDINHNFNAEWYKLRDFERASGINEPCAGRYGGFFPESEQETKAITRLLRGIPVDMVISFHSQGEEIFYEYGNNTPEKAYTIAGILSAVSGYRLVKNEGLYSSGGLKDWFIEEFRKPAFTIEVGKGENPLPLSEFDDIYNKIQTLLLMGLIL